MQNSKLDMLRYGVGHGTSTPERPNIIARPNGSNIWLLEYTAAGKALIEYGTERILSEPGNIFMYAPAVPQYYQMDPKTRLWEHIWITFSPRPEWQALLELPTIQPGFYWLDLPEGKARDKIKEALLEMRDVFHSPRHRRHEFVQNLMENVLLWLDTENPLSRSNRLDDRVTEVMEYICKNYYKSITISELAAEACLSESRMSHLFREETGMTPMQYLEKHRIERARTMLAVTPDQITSISSDVGFSSPFYFTRVFRRHTGMSPSEFRKQL